MFILAHPETIYASHTCRCVPRSHMYFQNLETCFGIYWHKSHYSFTHLPKHPLSQKVLTGKYLKA